MGINSDYVNKPSMCDVCTHPGHCCQRLSLSNKDGPFTYWRDEGEDAVTKLMAENNLPFLPLDITEIYMDEESGREYVTYAYRCPKLGADGRCTIYETRPQLCRDYQAGDDNLCVFFAPRWVA